jgi:signal transduction histidine kinase
VFLLLLALVGAAYIGVSLFASEMYFAETSQRLNVDLAKHIVDEIQPFVDGRPNFPAMDEIFHDVMVVNPAVEVYLLDSSGHILTFDAPPEKVKMNRVSLEPVREFLASAGGRFVLGDNPRDERKPRVFSAAPVTVNGTVYGYIYVILRGEEYDSAAGRIQQSHILGLALRGLLLSLLGAGLIGLVAIAFVTRKLRRLMRAVNAFREGDWTARVQVSSNDELDRLAGAFNEMAGTIEGNLDELRRADALRRELIANVSHDLRTPLASMQGYIETVLMKHETLQPGERQELLRVILGGAERLSHLVEELFELSKLEARESKPRPELFSLPELVNDLVQKFEPIARSRKVTVSASSAAGLPMVTADLGMIERVLQNLIDNAVKYNRPGGSVTITLSESAGKIRTTVEDTGIGIAEEDIPFLFDRFYRSRRGSREGARGAGLGLAIASKIMQTHGERIHVTRKPGGGSSFSFDLSP